MKSQLFLSVFLYRIKKCSPAQDPHFTNRKQTNRKSKVVQEAKVKYTKVYQAYQRWSKRLKGNYTEAENQGSSRLLYTLKITG